MYLFVCAPHSMLLESSSHSTREFSFVQFHAVRRVSKVFGSNFLFMHLVEFDL